MRHTSRLRFLPLITAALATSALLNLSCGGENPLKPSVTPSPTPTPSPSSGSTWSSTCSLGKGSAVANCDSTSSQLLPQLEAAMDRLIAAKPEIFDLSSEYSPETRAYKVVDRNAYLEGLVTELQKAGLCAEVDVYAASQDIVFAKDSNDFSEEFDVLLGSGHMRRGLGSYRYTCTPAAFPIEWTADMPPLGNGCYRPFPPPIDKMVAKEHIYNDGHLTLDSTPWVLDPFYCEAIGYTDGRAHCPVRQEGAIDRVACENWRVGNALDNARPGPTWTKLAAAEGEQDSYCTGRESSGCQNSESSQYQLWVWDAGTYRVCAQTGDCYDVKVD